MTARHAEATCDAPTSEKGSAIYYRHLLNQGDYARRLKDYLAWSVLGLRMEGSLVRGDETSWRRSVKLGWTGQD